MKNILSEYLNNKTVIACYTEEESLEICHLFEELGYMNKHVYGVRYIDEGVGYEVTRDFVLSSNGALEYSRIEYYRQENGYTFINASDLLKPIEPQYEIF